MANLVGSPGISISEVFLESKSGAARQDRSGAGGVGGVAG